MGKIETNTNDGLDKFKLNVGSRFAFLLTSSVI